MRNGANPNIVNKLYSQTPMHLAIINKMDEIVLNEFNNNKADIYNIKDKYDKTPFDYAKDAGDQTYLNLLKKIFADNLNYSNNNNLKKNNATWGQHTSNEIEDNMETTPVKVNYADKNNSNFISLTKNVFISFDENDSNKNNGSVIIKNVKEDNKNNTNKIYNSLSNKSESKYEESKIITTELKDKRKSNSNGNKSLNFTEPKSIKSYSNKINQSIEKSKKEEENIKNNSTETAKQINLSNNSIISSNFNFSAENNYSISNNNSKINNNSGGNSNKFRLSSIYSNNAKKNSQSNKASNCPTKRQMSEMNPLEMINQVITTSNNSNIFSDLQINSIINKHSQSDDDIKNKTVQENISNINNIILNDSLEYSKTNTHVISESSNQKKKNDKKNKSTNNEYADNIDLENINGLNITINEYEDINKNNENMKYNNNQSKQSNDKENIMPNYNIGKRYNNLSSSNYSLNNSKKISLINNTNQNELLTTVPNSIIGENNVVVKQKCYKNNQTQPESQKEKITKDLMVDEYQKNIESMNTYNNSYKYPNIGIKNSVVNNNKSTFSTFPNNNNNLIYSCSNNTYSINNKTNKFPSLKISEIENVNNNNSFFSKNNLNKSEEINICSPQNIPNELLIRLREWLISCDLLCYYNLLIKNEIYDIDLYIHNLKNNKINISYKDIEDIGIKKPGHIFRFLLKLQIDTGILDSQIYNLIRNKFNSNVLTTIGLTASTNIVKCCGITLFKENGNGNGDSHNKTNICCTGSTSSLNNNYTYNDIFGFLKYKDLIKFKENFIHNGFDQIDYIFIQLFSNFKFNREILNDYMHIYSENDKLQVIQKLYEEKKRIAFELGLLYDDDEEQKILNSQNETVGEKKENDDTCFIF